MTTIKPGDKVRFQAALSNGGIVQWTAVVVSVENGIAKVRHPAKARSFPFSPVAKPGLYRYKVETLKGC